MLPSQRGVTLLELILVIGLMSLITMLSFYEKQSDLEQAKAREVGGLLYQYNNAVRSAMANGLVTATTTKQGSNWLKNSSCGGVLPVGDEYLPCNFPVAIASDPIKFGKLSFSTAIVVSGAAPSRTYSATTITSPFTITAQGGDNNLRADLSGLAALSAAAALGSGYQIKSSSGFSPYAGTTDATYSSDPKTAKITVLASNSANNDVWLRTDGGNKMHASLGFDGTNPADRTITGASRVQNLAGQVLYLGSGSGLTPTTGAGVVIDSAAEILGDFRVRRTLRVDNSLNVTGDITATNSIKAGTTLESNGDVISRGNISANVNITAGGGMHAAGTISTSSGISAVGNISTSSGIQAAGNINTSSTVTASGNISSNGSVTAKNGMSTGGSIVAAGNITASGAVISSIYYDEDNTGYYVDPASTSNLNALQAISVSTSGRIRAGEYVEVAGVASVGGGCSPNGLLGRAADGGSLSCVSGKWTSASGFDLASCGVGESTSLQWSRAGTSSDAWIAAGNVRWHVNNLPAGQAMGSPVDRTKYQCMPYLWAGSMYAMCCPKS